MRPQLSDRSGLAAYDLKLFIDLAQHAVLIANGWTWGLMDDIGGQPMVVWYAPRGHRGSSKVYKHRVHAYNSHMKWNHIYLCDQRDP